MFSLYDDGWLWIVVIGFVVAFVLAFGVGANDVANAFGTSVGAKVITVKQACILGTIFEILGAILVGAKVSNTIRKGIITPDVYINGTEEAFMTGNVAALSGSCIWLLVATFFNLPVSGTHSVVGATLGFHLVINGTKGINWVKLLLIVGSWFLSPLMSGLVSVLLFKFVHIMVLIKKNPLENGLKLLPVFYAFTLAVNLFSIFYKGSRLLHFHKIPVYGSFLLAIGPAIIVAIGVQLILVPRQRRSITERMLKQQVETDNIDKEKQGFNEVNNGGDSITIGISSFIDRPGKEDVHKEKLLEDSADVENGDVPKVIIESEEKRSIARAKVHDKPEVAKLFTFLQVLTAIFGSFAHGGNDVSNAVGPLIAIWITATTGSSAQSAPVPIFVLAFGGVGISVGLWVWGRRVMKTLGEDLTKITPSSGFCIEIGSALTVLLASNVGIPISTTHCKVGSVVGVGRVRSKETVNWRLFTKIIAAWLITLPVSGGLSALVMYILKVTMDIHV